MKSKYALAMIVLLLLGIGGSVLGYRTAVGKVEAKEHPKTSAPEKPAAGGETAATAGDQQAATPPSGGQEPTPAKPEDGTQQGQTAEGGQDSPGADTKQEADATTAATATGDANAGHTTFSSTCGGCHGADGQGGVGPAMTKDATGWSQPEFFSTVREGNSPRGELAAMMPRFAKEQVSDDDLNNIYAWVQSLK
ncbi:c-type cytochrome [Deinococcus sp. Marseille-Q6407]|uniref:c-type cytochrome n=1 Tax=Deinococcus sp. Marseille-Q6407 TaxID=2969223 RepID=UPI0021BF6E6F|nr:cytochrome c [Deinococcus sp. Marseille-Q6407]